MPMRLSGLVTGMDTEAIVEQLMSAQSIKKKRVTDAKTKLEWKKEAWKDLNKKLTSFYNGSVSKMRLNSSYNLKKATLSDSTKASIDAQTNAVNGNYTMQVKEIASAQFLTSGKTNITSTSQVISESDDLKSMVGQTITIKRASDTGDGESITIDNETKVSDIINAMKKAGINASYDTTQKKFFLSSKQTGEENAFSITDSASGAALAKLGLGNVEVDGKDEDGNIAYKKTGAPSDMAFVGAKDSKIILNGAELTSASSTVSANGLNINLTSKTAEGESVSFSVSNDIDKVYENIKSALKEYNDLMKEMNTLYSAASSKGYDPLTAEEKRAMSEDEVKEWEKKIKDSLLRRDTTLEGIISGMRSSMMSNVTVNGNVYSLSSFGIMTSTNYQEGGLLHIYGDPDDDVYSGEKDKLKDALTNNPEETIEALSGLFEKLRSTMMNKMSATQYSSALTFYNDKQMDTELADYKTEIKTWEDKFAAMEDAYYKKFSAMESAMAKLQSQTSSLTSLFGG